MKQLQVAQALQKEEQQRDEAGAMVRNWRKKLYLRGGHSTIE